MSKPLKKQSPSKPRTGAFQDALFTTKVDPNFKFPEARSPITDVNYDLRNYVKAAPYSWPAGSGYGQGNISYNQTKPSTWQQSKRASSGPKYTFSLKSIFLIFLVIIGLCTVVNEVVTDGPGIIMPAKDRVIPAVAQGFADVRDFISKLIERPGKEDTKPDKPVIAPPPKNGTKKEAKPRKPREPYKPKYTPRGERNTTSWSFAKLLDIFRNPTTNETTKETSKETTNQVPEEDKSTGAGDDPIETTGLWYEKIPFNILFLPAVDGFVRKASKSVPGKGKPTKGEPGKKDEPDKPVDTPGGFFDEKSEKDVFARMINAGFELSEPALLSYPTITDLASKLRIAHEVFHRGEQIYKKHNASLSARNADAKITWGRARTSLSSINFIPAMQGNDMFASMPKKLLQAMKNLEANDKKSTTGEIRKEAHRTLWLKYQHELEVYYSRAEDWLKRIAKARGYVKHLSEAVELTTPILFDNYAEDVVMNKKQKGDVKYEDARLAAQVQLLGGIGRQGKATDVVMLTAIEKLMRVLEHREIDARRFAKFKEGAVIKDIREQIDVVILLQQETEKSMRLANDAWKDMTSKGRFKAGEHPEL